MITFKKSKTMTDKNKKQFGVWMDTHHATVVGKKDLESNEFVILGHVKNEGASPNSNENTAHNQEITLTQKYFKEITSLMQNVDEIHLTGTGQIQEQFMKYLGETPQYKNAHSSESTTNKMSDEHLLIMIAEHFS